MKLKDIKKGQQYVSFFPNTGEILSIVEADGEKFLSKKSFSGKYLYTKTRPSDIGSKGHFNSKYFIPYDEKALIKISAYRVEKATSEVAQLRNRLDEAEGYAQKTIEDHEILIKRYKAKTKNKQNN